MALLSRVAKHQQDTFQALNRKAIPAFIATALMRTSGSSSNRPAKRQRQQSLSSHCSHHLVTRITRPMSGSITTKSSHRWRSRRRIRSDVSIRWLISVRREGWKLRISTMYRTRMVTIQIWLQITGPSPPSSVARMKARSRGKTCMVPKISLCPSSLSTNEACKLTANLCRSQRKVSWSRAPAI